MALRKKERVCAAVKAEEEDQLMGGHVLEVNVADMVGALWHILHPAAHCRRHVLLS